MISIAITGGIGSGKTYISNLLQERGIPIYNADNEAKRLMLGDEVIRRGLIGLLGDNVYLNDELNKPLLASYLFSSPGHVKQINSIVHPRVKVDFQEWLKSKQENEVAGIESAILFEAGFQDSVDFVLMVFAPMQLRLERAMARDGASEQQIRERMAAQLDEDKKTEMSDFVLINDGSTPLDSQIDAFLEILKTSKK
ncbi:MAG: dephospho-CoA kinase [Parabacteroides sp.]|nr:dephospho-CoA kinase [Parabacteroides sp.]